jgi:hypothetical protein
VKSLHDIETVPYRIEEVSTIPILKPKQPAPETAEQLAAEHARAKQEYETRRASVLERGRKRVQELDALANEVAKERNAHARLVDSL